METAKRLGALEAEVRKRREDLTALTVELIRFPTINPPGEAYEPCAWYLGERLRRRGFQVEYVRAHDTPGDCDRYPRTNVIARREGAAPGATVHFNSHIDVVEVGAGWTMEPFRGEVRNGRVYGRGACDMKGGLAASVIAAETYVDLCPDHPGAVEVSGTVDEESGGFGGVAHLARQGFFSRPRVDHVIIPEPLHKDRICLGHRGVWWAQVETFGTQAHGSMPFLGDCAVRHMGAFVQRLEAELYPALAQKRTAMPVVPEGARQSTLNLNAIHGGEAERKDYDGLPAPNVPDSCRLVLDRRFLIEEELAQVKAEVVSILDDLKRRRDRFDYAIHDLMEVMPTMTASDAPVVRAVETAVRSVLGREAEHVISPGTYDQKHIARIGHLHDCIAYGPGLLDLAHMADEWVGIDDMVDSACVMVRALDALLRSPCP